MLSKRTAIADVVIFTPVQVYNLVLLTVVTGSGEACLKTLTTEDLQ
ncbi:hypothetical protein [Nostoc sp. UIC 10630]|nr:hypothetical protein [Nostoc sp. UIC 10630]NEU82827.1 hypothetical protein [Nostoc sp. UIC 10630]